MANPTGDVVKYDVTDVDPGGGGDWGGNGHQPKPGIVVAKVVRCNPRTENRAGDSLDRPDIEWVFEVGATPGREEAELEDGAWVAIYTGAQLKGNSFGLANVLEALGVIKDERSRKGTFSRKAMINRKCRLRIVADTYNDQYKARIGRVLKFASDASESSAKPSTSADPSTLTELEDEPPF